MLRRNPWVILLCVLLLAGCVFTIVLLRAAPVDVDSQARRFVSPEIQAEFSTLYGLERPTTSLARRLGFVRQSSTSASVEPLEMLRGATQGVDQALGTEDSRLVIYTVQTSLVVSDVEQALAQIEDLTARANGYVTSSSTQQYGNNTRATISIRVPAAQLDDIRAELRSLALEVRNETRSGQDVTEEYVDLDARVQVLEAAAQELQELYATRQESGEVTDILAVYEELVSFREQIDSLKGRKQYLEQSAALATITIELVPDELARPIEVSGWRPQGTVRAAFEALLTMLQHLSDSAIWFCIYTAPQVLLLVAVVYVLWWLVGKRLYEKVKAMRVRNKRLTGVEEGNEAP